MRSNWQGLPGGLGVVVAVVAGVYIAEEVAHTED